MSVGQGLFMEVYSVYLWMGVMASFVCWSSTRGGTWLLAANILGAET